MTLRKPDKPNGGVSHRLHARQIEGGLVPLIREVAIEFKVATKALNYIEIQVVEGSASGDEILCGFLRAQSELEPLIAAQMISNPCLTTLILAANPVAEKLPLISVACFWTAS